ncbi:unnamed protein product, partial [Ectocarpus sp. 8 AP-2014]
MVSDRTSLLVLLAVLGSWIYRHTSAIYSITGWRRKSLVHFELYTKDPRETSGKTTASSELYTPISQQLLPFLHYSQQSLSADRVGSGMPRAMASSSPSPPNATVRSTSKRRQPTEINFAALSPPAGSLSSEGDDATSVGFSASATEAALAQCGMDAFNLQNPTAPPLSRGTSTASWTARHRRKRSDSTSSLDVTGPRAPGSNHQQQQQQPQGKATKPLPPSKHGRPRGIPNDVSGSTYPFVRQQAAGQGTDGAAAQRVIKPHRPVMSRYCRYTFYLRDALDTVDADVDGVGACCGLCRAPPQLPCLAWVFPCCAYPEELEQARRESSYLVIRDTSVEFNNPKVVMGSRPSVARVASADSAHGNGQYSGACGCTFHVRDDARVLYFDDPALEDMTPVFPGGGGCSRFCCGRRPSTAARLMAEARQLLCGGRGQAVRVQSRVCCGACVRARGLLGLPCVPSCCACACRSATLRYDMPAK